MSKRKAKAAQPSLKRAMNPYVPLRASTEPSKKKVASKRACRGQHRVTD